MIVIGKPIFEALMTSGSLFGVVQNIIEPMLANCKEQWEQHIRTNFDTEGSLVGGWHTLADSTKKLREKLGYATEPILNMRGVLKKSAVVESSSWLPRASVSLIWGGKRRGGALKTWNGKSLTGLHHYGWVGYNPLTKETFSVPRRELYNETTLKSIFENTVEKPFNRAIEQYAFSILGGKK